MLSTHKFGQGVSSLCMNDHKSLTVLCNLAVTSNVHVLKAVANFKYNINFILEMLILFKSYLKESHVRNTNKYFTP